MPHTLPTNGMTFPISVPATGYTHYTETGEPPFFDCPPVIEIARRYQTILELAAASISGRPTTPRSRREAVWRLAPHLDRLAELVPALGVSGFRLNFCRERHPLDLLDLLDHHHGGHGWAVTYYPPYSGHKAELREHEIDALGHAYGHGRPL